MVRFNITGRIKYKGEELDTLMILSLRESFEYKTLIFPPRSNILIKYDSPIFNNIPTIVSATPVTQVEYQDFVNHYKKIKVVKRYYITRGQGKSFKSSEAYLFAKKEIERLMKFSHIDAVKLMAHYVRQRPCTTSFTERVFVFNPFLLLKSPRVIYDLVSVRGKYPIFVDENSDIYIEMDNALFKIDYLKLVPVEYPVDLEIVGYISSPNRELRNYLFDYIGKEKKKIAKVFEEVDAIPLFNGHHRSYLFAPVFVKLIADFPELIPVIDHHVENAKG